MDLVNKAAGDCPRAAVQILVAAPNRKIDLPIMQMQHDVAGRVGKVPTDHAAVPLRGCGDPLQVEPLAGEEVDGHGA